MRLDRLIASSGVLSRSQTGKAIRTGRVTVNGMRVTVPYEVRMGGNLTLTVKDKARKLTKKVTLQTTY